MPNNPVCYNEHWKISDLSKRMLDSYDGFISSILKVVKLAAFNTSLQSIAL